LPIWITTSTTTSTISSIGWTHHEAVFRFLVVGFVFVAVGAFPCLVVGAFVSFVVSVVFVFVFVFVSGFVFIFVFVLVFVFVDFDVLASFEASATLYM